MKSKGKFVRNLLPNPGQYFRSQNLKLIGRSEWKSARCPFHNDSTPSLRIRVDIGCFRCMACGESGGDVLEFHRKLHHLDFITAAKELGAWEDK